MCVTDFTGPITSGIIAIIAIYVTRKYMKRQTDVMTRVALLTQRDSNFNAIVKNTEITEKMIEKQRVKPTAEREKLITDTLKHTEELHASSLELTAQINKLPVFWRSAGPNAS